SRRKYRKDRAFPRSWNRHDLRRQGFPVFSTTVVVREGGVENELQLRRMLHPQKPSVPRSDELARRKPLRFEQLPRRGHLSGRDQQIHVVGMARQTVGIDLQRRTGPP